MNSEPDNLPALSGSFTVAPRGDFMSGTDGNPRLAWTRYEMPWGFGFNGMAHSAYTIGPYGSRHDRERHRASVVSHELANSNPVLATANESIVTNTVFTGLTLSSKPDAEALGITEEQARKLSHDIETAWTTWTQNPLEVDQSGRFNLHELASVAMHSANLSGEILAALDVAKCRDARTRTKVALLDTRQLDATITGERDGFKVVQGVAFDNGGRRVGYYLRNMPLGQYVVQPMAKFVASHSAWGRPKVFHKFIPLDPRQVRGLPVLTPALTPAHERESLSEFHLANAMLQSAFALTVESDLPPQTALGSLEVNNDFGGMNKLMQMRDNWYSKARLNPQPGVVNHLSPGDHLKFNKVENPSAQFDQFDKSLTRKAARAAGESYENISGDYSSTSFSASRMASEMPYRTMAKRREVLIVPFYRAVFECWLEEMLETGAIELPEGAPAFWQNRDAYLQCKFLGVGRFQPDPKKQTEADVLALENNLTTLEEVLAERGRDLETHLEQCAAERKLLAKYGLGYPGAVVTQQRDEKIEDDRQDIPSPSPVNLPNKRNRK